MAVATAVPAVVEVVVETRRFVLRTLSFTALVAAAGLGPEDLARARRSTAARLVLAQQWVCAASVDPPIVRTRGEDARAVWVGSLSAAEVTALVGALGFWNQVQQASTWGTV
ncbi:MAG: hypothetical protein KJ066_16265 [Acidobacteria bacterium]|nr:hypothetical protein [Acidobacteriota bacterium]